MKIMKVGMKMSDKLTKSLARFAKRVTYEQLKEETVLEVKRRLLDTFGCLIAGYESNATQSARKFASQYVLSHGARLIGTDLKVASEYATLANGAAIRYLDFNDTYLSVEPLHPSDVIAPLLALAEEYQVDSKRLITAISTAYEVGVLLCDHASLKNNGWDHVNYITIATVVGGANLLNLKEEETVQALSLAIVPHAAMRQTRNGEISEWKGVAAANAAKNAVFALKLAKCGMNGPYEPIEGSMGMNTLMLNNKLNTEKFASDIDDIISPQRILQTYIKNWAVEYMTQSAIEAAILLKSEFKDINQIKKIEINTFQLAYDVLAKDEQKWHPKTRETADHSLPYIVMVALEDGEIDLNTFSEERLKNEGTLKRIKELISITVTEEMESGYPAGNPNKITITFKDGSTVSSCVTKPKGHSSNPMNNEQIEEKFIRITSNLLSLKQQQEILENVWRFENIKHFDDIYTSLVMSERLVKGGV